MTPTEIFTAALVVVGVITLANTVILALIKMGVSQFSKEQEAVWEAIQDIRAKQLSLRGDLPKDYLRVGGEGYRALISGIDEIKGHIQTMARDCQEWRETRCPVATFESRLSKVEGIVKDRGPRIMKLEGKK